MTLENVELTLVESMDDVVALLQWLGRRRPYHAIAVDTETSGLDRYSDHIRLCQVGDDARGFAFAWDRWRGLLDDIVRRWDGDYILHNAPFDVGFLGRAGVHLPKHRIHDTLVQARINEPHMSAALKPQATRHVDSAAAGLQDELAGTKWTWATVPINYQPYWTYGALDPVLAYHLHMYHHPIVMRDAPRSYELELPVLWIVERMKENGAFIDVEFARHNLDRFTAYCHEIADWCKRTYGVNPGANNEVIHALQLDGVTFEKRTKSGALSLDADVLDDVDHPLAQAVLQRRKAQKMASTYLRFYVERSDENHLIHPSFNSLGARTGRMSSSDPNLQNLPRRGTSKFGDVIRSCIKTRYGDAWESPSLETMTGSVEDFYRRQATDPARGALIMCDYSQIEMRMMAHFARERGMIEAFKSDGDFFVNLARQIFQDDTITKKDPRRQITKNAGYSKIYGSGIRKFSLTAGIPESQGREFMSRWDMMYPGVSAFSETIINTALQRRAETGVASANSPLTNRLLVTDAHTEYKLVNYVVQGAAAEVNKMKLIELDAAGLGEWMFGTVHDEVLLDVPGAHVDDAVNTVLSIMNDDALLSVPVEADASFGERWGTKMTWTE